MGGDEAASGRARESHAAPVLGPGGNQKQGGNQASLGRPGSCGDPE